MQIRFAVKRLAEHALASAPSVLLARQLRRGTRLILSYHNVVESVDPARLGDSSLHLPLARLREQIAMLERSDADIVPVDVPLPGHRDRPQIAITFDDACAGAINLAIPEFASRDMPVTVFVAPELLGSPSPWWDRVSDPQNGIMPDPVRELALVDLRGEGVRILREAVLRGWSVAPPNPAFRIATELEIDRALEIHPRLDIGAHSWSHPNLAALGEAEVVAELQQSLDWILARWPGRTVPWVAYPYGLSTGLVHDTARAVGYAGGLRGSGGLTSTSSNVFLSPRLNVTPGLSSPGFRARVLGLWPPN